MQWWGTFTKHPAFGSFTTSAYEIPCLVMCLHVCMCACLHVCTHACMNACLHGCMQCVDWLSQETHALPCQICELSPLPWHHLAKSEIKLIDWGKKSQTCVSWPSMVSPAPQQGLIVLSPWIATCMGSRSFSGMLGAHGSDLNVYYWSSVWQPYQQNRGALPVQVGPPAQSKILNPYTWCRLDRGTACMHACMISFQTKQPLQFAKKIWVTSWGSECKKEAHACSEMHEHIFTQPVKMSRCMPPRMEFTRSSCMHERYSRLRWISAQMLPLVWSPHP